jgi:hypothetical protein
MEPGSGLFVAEVCGTVAFANAKPDDGTWDGGKFALGKRSDRVEIDLHFVSLVSAVWALLVRIIMFTTHFNSPLTAHLWSASLHVIDVLDSAIPTNLVMLRNTIGHVVNVWAWHPLAARHECRTVAEQLVHIFEVETFRFWLEAPKEDGIEEVTDHEDEVEFLANVLVCSWDLVDHVLSPIQ